MDRVLLGYLPPVIQEVLEFRKIMATEQTQAERAWEAVHALILEPFILHASAGGLSRWEGILGIYPKDTDTPEDRRTRVVARMNAKLPYTMRELHRNLQSLCGENGYEIALDTEKHYLYFAIDLQEREKEKTVISEVKLLLRQMIPANLITDIFGKLLEDFEGQGYISGVAGECIREVFGDE